MAAGVNMVIGLFVVTFGVFRRWTQHAWTTDQIALGLIMAAASLLGATMGVRHAHKFASPLLKRIVCVYLTLVGIWMLFEAFAHVETILMQPEGTLRWVLAA